MNVTIMMIDCGWRHAFRNDEVNRLRAEGFAHQYLGNTNDSCGFVPTDAGLIRLR